ncbi:MAG: hypothetical protein WBW73_26045, partial [Rhodoplanes sp.]
FKIDLVGNCHAANSVSPEVFPDQFVWIAVGRICAATYGLINNWLFEPLARRSTPTLAFELPLLKRGAPARAIEQ